MAEVRTARPEGVAAYAAVTGAYWAFMLTDGALRMLVLLHFNRLGFTPIQLAYLFLLYEIAGIVTNLSAGWIAARFGLTSTLYAGLALQICALLALAQLDPSWAVGASVIFVMAIQGVSGVAKDLAKMSSKSAVKIFGARRSARCALPLGGAAHRLQERRQRPWLPARRSAAGAGQFRGLGARHGGRAPDDPRCGRVFHAERPAAGPQGREVRRGLFQRSADQLALGGAPVPLRRA